MSLSELSGGCKIALAVQPPARRESPKLIGHSLVGHSLSISLLLWLGEVRAKFENVTRLAIKRATNIKKVHLSAWIEEYLA